MEECRLYLVPDAILKSWKSSQTLADIDNPGDTLLAKRDASVTSALNQTQLDPRDRDVLLQQETGKFLNAKKLRDDEKENALATFSQRVRDAVTPTTTPMTSDDSDMLDVLPKTYRPKARALLQQWAKTGEVTWDETNKVYLKGVPIPGSNVVDLIHHAVTRKKSPPPPPGFETLRQFVSTYNLPQTMYGNPQWYATSVLPPPKSFRTLQKTPTRVSHPLLRTPSHKSATPRTRGQTPATPVRQWVNVK